MKRTIVALMALSSFGTFAKSANLTELQKSLNDMQPLSISDDRGIVTVVLNEATITPDIYDNAILGVCSPAWMNSNNSAYLKNTKENRMNIKRRIPSIIGLIIGGIGGYIYYLTIGCSSGSCPITSNPWLSVLWGLILGYLIGDLFTKKKKEN